MAGRPKIFDETEAIRKATEIFWRKGYEASSTEDLLDAMGIGKGSFYLHFKDGKKELFQRSLDLFSEDAMKRFNEKLSQTDDEVNFLKKFILSLADGTSEQKQKGCYLGNAIVEMSNVDPKTKAHAAALMEKLELAFEKIIRKAQASKELKTQTNARLLAKYLINVRNGIHVTMRSEKNKDDLKNVLIQSLEILQ
jgi:TetR/AcrR family transcriptional regulator, transcriptional repressor for nem operon